MDLAELFLGQIPEAIYFTLFMIFAKNLKEKRILFIILMIIEYLLLIYTFQYNWMFHIGFMITTVLTLKVLYKEKSQITDIFILLISYIVMIISSAICVFAFMFNTILAAVANRILLFILLVGFKDEIMNIQSLYKHLWNRSEKPSVNKIKSITFRSINLVVFNIIYVIINVGMIFAIYYNNMKGVM